MFEDLRDLYQEVILDHGRRPRHGEKLACFDASARGDNPLCGDRIELTMKYGPGGEIGKVGFRARGCAISVAAADLMAEVITGLSAPAAEILWNAYRTLIQTGTVLELPAPLAERLERLAPLAGVHEFPSRVKCATLPWHALRAALSGQKDASSE